MVVSRQRKCLPMFDRLSPLWGKIWVVQQGTIELFPGSANFGKTLFYYHMTNLIQSKSII
jgi:hypothetical protein